LGGSWSHYVAWALDDQRKPPSELRGELDVLWDLAKSGLHQRLLPIKKGDKRRQPEALRRSRLANPEVVFVRSA
jgi:hypothetical protein